LQPSQTQINELKEEASHRKAQLKELTNFLDSDNHDGMFTYLICSFDMKYSFSEEVQFDLIRSFLQSCTSFRLSLSNKLSVIDNNESILQRIDDYQSIINQLNSQENNWTNETTDKLVMKLKSMVKLFLIRLLFAYHFIVQENAGNTVEDLQKQLSEAIHNEKQLQIDIEEIANEFTPTSDDHQGIFICLIFHK